MLNIEFIEFNNDLKNYINEDNIDSIIITDYIADTNIYCNSNMFANKIINNLFKNNNCVGTNISYYFGYTNKINVTPKNVNNIICNIIIKSNDNYLWSDLIIKHYNANFNNYTNKQIVILNKNLENIKSFYYKIIEDIKILDKKKYELDIVNKSIYEYVSFNLNSIIENLFHKIHIFYILSIIFNNNKKHIAIYDKKIVDELKQFI